MDLASKIANAARTLGIDLTVDPDELHMEAAMAEAEYSSNAVFDLGALALNLAMLNDETAAQRYLEIYGKPFRDVPALAGDDIAPRRSPRLAIGTDADTTKTVGMRR